MVAILHNADVMAHRADVARESELARENYLANGGTILRQTGSVQTRFHILQGKLTPFATRSAWGNEKWRFIPA